MRGEEKVAAGARGEIIARRRRLRLRGSRKPLLRLFAAPNLICLLLASSLPLPSAEGEFQSKGGTCAAMGENGKPKRVFEKPLISPILPQKKFWKSS